MVAFLGFRHFSKLISRRFSFVSALELGERPPQKILYFPASIFVVTIFWKTSPSYVHILWARRYFKAHGRYLATSTISFVPSRYPLCGIRQASITLTHCLISQIIRINHQLFMLSEVYVCWSWMISFATSIFLIRSCLSWFVAFLPFCKSPSKLNASAECSYLTWASPHCGLSRTLRFWVLHVAMRTWNRIRTGVSDVLIHVIKVASASVQAPRSSRRHKLA